MSSDTQDWTILIQQTLGTRHRMKTKDKQNEDQRKTKATTQNRKLKQ